MTDNESVVIKIVTDNMSQEFKFLIYCVLWSICTLNVWIYVKILQNIKGLCAKPQTDIDRYRALFEHQE